MTATTPPAVAGVPAEAVEAAAELLQINAEWWNDRARTDVDRFRDWASEVLAAALPHLRAQVLAEVDAALRDDERFYEWRGQVDSVGPHQAADYLRDTLAGDGGEE